MKAFLVVSHGSRNPKAAREIEDLTGRLRKKSGAEAVEAAYLEINSPDIPEGISKCVNQGATEVILLLNFLNAGNHVLEDVPALVEAARKRYPGVKFVLTPHLGANKKTDDIFLDLIAQAESN